MAQPQEFPFNIMDVAELLHLHIRRRQADSVYADCPICGDKRGKMNINFAKNLWRCNYCNEGGGMLSLYGKVYGISNSEAYREICDTLQNGLTAPEYTAKELPEQTAIEQSVLASPQEIHQTFSMLLELLTLNSVCDDLDFILVAVCDQLREPTVQDRTCAAGLHTQYLVGITVQNIHQLHEQLCAWDRRAGFNMADMRSSHIDHCGKLFL